MHSNLDIKVSSLFKEKKPKNNGKIKIKLESDSEDDKNINNNYLEPDDDSKGNHSDFIKKVSQSENTNINLDENKENIKSGSQVSISTSTTQSNNSSNSKNFPAPSSNSKKSNRILNNHEKNATGINGELYDLLNVSLGTKKIIEKIREKRIKAKKEQKMMTDNINYFNSNCNNINKETKKYVGKKTKSYDLNNNNKETTQKNDSMKLSERTQEAIKKLTKIRSNNANKNNKDNIILIRQNSFSNLHVKYEALLQQSRELRLPITYLKLFESFISLERTINRNKISNKNNLNTFNNIRNIVESYTNKNFNVSIFKQILYIVPHFYILKYINSNSKQQAIFFLNENLDKNYDLIIEIPNDFNERIKRNYPRNFNFLDINYYSETSNNFEPLLRNLTENELLQRRQIFQNILNYIVNDYHEKYLKENKIKIKFNPLKQKTWYHSFDPDKHCGPIPLFDFPSPPEYKSIFVETINKNDIKSQIASINYNSNNGNKKISKVSSSANKFVSEEYFKKIKAKEEVLNIVKEINKYNYYYNQKNDRNKIIKNIIIQIKTLLMTHKKSLELNTLSELILNSDIIFKDFFENIQNLNELIIKICKKYGDFINITNHSRLGPIVVLKNNEYQIPDNFTDIE